MTLRVRIRLTTGHPNLLDQMLLTSLSSIPTPECLPPKFCRGTNLRWANVLPNVVQHGNHAVPRAGSCPGTAVFGAVSCKQKFCRTIVQKQWAESPWPVPPCGVSPTLWTKSVSSSQGYGHVKAHHCIIVKLWPQSWWACAWIPPQPTHIRPLICSIWIFVLLPLIPAMSKVLLSNELVAWVLRDFQRTASYIWFFCLAVFTGVRAYFSYLVPYGKGRHCVASYFHKPSICILAIFSLDSAPNLSRWDRPLSQTYLVVAPRLLVWPLGRHSIYIRLTHHLHNFIKIYTISGPEFPNSRMSSAKRRSTNLSRVSPKWKPAFPVPFLHGPNTHSRGLKTQPCGTPPAMENLRFLPHFPAKNVYEMDALTTRLNVLEPLIPVEPLALLVHVRGHKPVTNQKLQSTLRSQLRQFYPVEGSVSTNVLPTFCLVEGSWTNRPLAIRLKSHVYMACIFYQQHSAVWR